MKIKFTVFLLISSLSTFANNIVVSNVSVASQNTSLKYKMIRMDVAWSNSWRTYNYETNYDAAWIFIKYRKLSEQVWRHATLNYVNGTADGHTKPTSSDINTASDGKGVFLFRANTSPTKFIGNVNYVGAQLRWNYGVDGLADTDLAEIAVFAIEMVYVPQGAFYVGDASATNSDNPFRFQDGATSNPFYVASEAQLTLGGSTAGNLSIPQNSYSGNKDDFSQTVTQTLPVTFPKGFKGFYCMKYELSQEQYGEFLKKLSPTQATLRYQNAFGTNRFTIDASYNTQAPNRACYVRWHDGVAYADWSGLRPMTELEYEKACRGPVFPVPGEYAWGNTILRRLSVIASDGTPSETDGNAPRANVHHGQGTGYTNPNPLYGPMRVGWTVGGSRENAGDTYYGISDMSGNLEEATVPVSSAIHRSFIGTHGDGNLSPAGRATNLDWPGYSSTTSDVSSAVLVKFKGGSIFGDVDDIEQLQVSKRSGNFSIDEQPQREPYLGLRCVRTIN